MATYCPKCNYKLRLRDYKPECPECGINLVYYGMEERLRAEADAAELEYAKNKPKTDRIKAATVGNKLAKTRLVLYVLPIFALLLPLGHINMVLPFYEKATTLNLISLVTALMDFDFDLLLAMFESSAFGKEFIMLGVALVSILLVLILSLVSAGLLTLSCAPKGLVRNFTFNAINILLTVTSIVSFKMAADGFSTLMPSICSASLSWGAFVLLLVFVACVVSNIMQKVKGIEVKYTDVSEYFMPYEERPSTIAAKAAEKEALAKAAETLAKNVEAKV